MGKNRTRLGWGLGTAMGLVLAAGAASANDQTEAGTKVGNTFTLDYTVNGTAQTTITNATGTLDSDGVDTGATTFVVDRRIDVNVTNVNGATVAPGATTGQLVFRVENEGNDNQRYGLNVDALSSGLSGFTVEWVIDDGDDTYEPGTGSGEDGAPTTHTSGTVGTYPELAPGQVAFVVISGSAIPTNATNGSTLDVALLATTYQPATYANGSTGSSGVSLEAADGDGNDVNAVENVFADATGPATADDDTNPDGEHSATGTYTVTAASLAGTKDVFMLGDGDCPAATPVKPTASVSGAYAVPGACVAYVIDVANSGGATANDIDLADSLPEGITFLDAAMFGEFAVSGNGATLTKAAASCAPSSTVTCTVRIDDGVLDATESGSLVIWTKISGTTN